MLHVVIEKEVFCHLTFLQSMLMISLMNFDNLDMVFALLRCLWAVSSMLMTLSCSLVTATYLLTYLDLVPPVPLGTSGSMAPF